MSLSPEELCHEIEEIKKRNQRVEIDKAWETSLARKFMITCLTYTVIVIFFLSADLPRPYINAIVPTIGFLLSTITGDMIKKRWIEKVYKK
jgi:peptidoglycan/LPS O-acetylase OafA/YrhL